MRAIIRRAWEGQRAEQRIYSIMGCHG